MDKKDIFIEAGLVTEKELEMANKEKEKTPWVAIGEILVMLNLASDKAVANAYSAQLNLPLVELAFAKVDTQLLSKFTGKLAKKFLAFPLELKDKTLKLAMTNPLDFNAIQAIEFKMNARVSPVVATYSDLRSAIEKYYFIEEDIEEIINDSRYNQGPEFIDEEQVLDSSSASLNKLKKESQTPPIVRIVNKILQRAVRMNASDIHIEPQESIVKVRYRIDGIMNDIMEIPKGMSSGIVSRIKITASLDITERKVPQDGKLKMMYEGHSYDVRISTLPTKYGEKVVMRLLNTSSSSVSLDEIGLFPREMRSMLQFSELKQGIVLVTGPTGSGKTTTLYALIKELLQRRLNIITFEDPVEYQIPGVNQVQINEKKGLTFASGLRSALRQDPDVIMVGEIRDTETLTIALQAAITGHLVLSTVHTNDAVSTIARLRQLGAESFQISSGLAGIIAQRLVRTICNSCKQTYTPNPQAIKKLQTVNNKPFNNSFYQGKGCEKCSNTGYRGRIGAYEILNINTSIQNLIVSDATDLQIREKAMEQGMFSMVLDCLEKVRYGFTTIDEMDRVFLLESQNTEKCPNCQKLVNQEFTICPYCSFNISCVCLNCNKKLDPAWNICPYCRTEVGMSFPSQKALPAYNTGQLALPPAFHDQFQSSNTGQLALPPAFQTQTQGTDYPSTKAIDSYLNSPSRPYNYEDVAFSTPTKSNTNPLPNPPIAQQVAYPPPQAQPVQAQPVQAQPVQAQPVQAQPVQAQPVQAQPIQAQPVLDSQSSAQTGRRNILLVEGDEILVAGLHSYLTKENFNIKVARDGLQALELMLARSFKPDLVVVDIVTLRMDGYEFIRTLRQESTVSFLPIIILSTKESIEDKLLGFTLGIDDYLDKPFSSEELTACINTVLRRIYG